MIMLALCIATMRTKPGESVERYVGCTTRLYHTSAPGDASLMTANASMDEMPVYVRYNTKDDNLGIVGSYQALYEESTEPVLCYVHDDVIMRERGWDIHVRKEFEDPTVGVVGFGGALRHGIKELYKVPYQLQQLRRMHYRSNVDDAEVHGERFSAACDVSVLDGYFLAVRRDLLDKCGGWNAMVVGCDFFCYDYAICALARRHGYRLRLVGVRCHHRGGGTSVAEGGKVITGQQAYDLSHKWFYEEFRDVMPHEV